MELSRREPIAAIVADADAAFDPEALWPAHEWDAREKPLPLSGLYVGAAGVTWALDELQRRGHAGPSRNLAAAVMRAVELERATPDFAADEHYRPGALMSGETGALLVALRLTSNAGLADNVHALIRGNVDNPTDDISWGAPGTLLAGATSGAGDFAGDELCELGLGQSQRFRTMLSKLQGDIGRPHTALLLRRYDRSFPDSDDCDPDEAVGDRE